MSIDDQEKIQDERREFFRIDDSIRVSYRVIPAADIPTSIDEQLRAGERFTVMTRLQEISQHLSASMHRIEQRDTDIADYLKALDEKINLLGRSFLTEARELLDRPSQQVNLSAGGLAMDITEEVEVGSKVEVKMLLLPSFSGLLAYGEVVGSEPSEGEHEGFPYHVRINFTMIRGADQDALIRHITRRQGEMLRHRRELKELEEDES
ncbi:MAG: PilZ domain-containing protein [Candidatus Thiodiazotropha taylori]|nr:PilZ domain-containing protein [Candidatus Thiodiazotropha taylori]MCG7925026.1 PilZ domain-containing protein [Candidatus Thiodiazotropha taylori]MCG7933353.1 PilZ domain-containing protein [Candidatus Thiodiazotropha taylori]MCG7970576.1 PilZ domain-containing protein [Candidatus Thiodiazotropha taylori]